MPGNEVAASGDLGLQAVYALTQSKDVYLWDVVDSGEKRSVIDRVTGVEITTTFSPQDEDLIAASIAPHDQVFRLVEYTINKTDRHGNVKYRRRDGTPKTERIGRRELVDIGFLPTIPGVNRQRSIIGPSYSFQERSPGGQIVPKSRASVVFHELREMYRQDFVEGQKNWSQAHYGAIKDEESLLEGDIRKSKDPGGGIRD